MTKVFFPLLFLISLVLNIFFIRNNISERTVSRVIDGDTFVLNNGDRIRLLGIDAPELGRCGADKAQEKLSALVLQKTVIIREEHRDAYGRRMGLVYIGNILVNEAMLAAGLARPDYDKNTKSGELKSAFHEAVSGKIGIHSNECKKTSPIPPIPGCTIKGNIDQGTWEHFYHLPNCRHYNQIVLNLDMGEQFFCTEKEARDAGFVLAPDCLR